MTNAQKQDQETDNANKHAFETDVSRLLDIVANALYSNRDVFLRELISNAADACDRLRYDAIQNSDLKKDDTPFGIHIKIDRENQTLTLQDNGVGMDKEDLVQNLGTIARSGTSAILENLKKQGNADDMSLIGQFGVGFYASFMVAGKVTVISQKAGTDQAYKWTSDGKTGYDISEASSDEASVLNGAAGTAITLHLKSDAIDYSIDDKIKQIVLTYSDHIDLPVFLDTQEQGADEPINAASALWTRPKSEITEEQYKEFYHHIGQAFDEPLLTVHWKAEGVIEYTGLLFIPTMRPFDLYDPQRQHAVRLYVKKVFISDKIDNLVYPWLRFIRGIVDTQDLPLNISREMLQNNPVVAKMRSGMTKKVLSELDKLASNDEAAFESFWYQFGAVLKEGLYDAVEHRADIFKVCRFTTTDNSQTLTSLADYIARMKDGQDEIYYLSGENAESLKKSPQLEGFTSRGLEVLLLTDTVDEFWLQMVTEFEGKKFRSVTKGQVDFSKFDSDNDDKQDEEKSDEEKASSSAMEKFTHYLKEQLKDEISYVRISKRLTESPVCLVAEDGNVDMHMEKVLKIQQQYDPTTKRVLEINKDHALIKKLAQMHDSETESEILKDSAMLLLDQAMIIQGESVNDASGFARRMATFMEKGLAV